MRIYGRMQTLGTGSFTDVEPDEWVRRLAVDIPDLEYLIAKTPDVRVEYTIDRSGDEDLPDSAEVVLPFESDRCCGCDRPLASDGSCQSCMAEVTRGADQHNLWVEEMKEGVEFEPLRDFLDRLKE